MSTQAITRTTSARTILDLTVPTGVSLWAVVDAWAAGSGYRLITGAGNQRVYQKGTGFLVAPMMLELALDGERLTLQAWVRNNLFVRIMALFLLPAELNIGKGFRAVLPRSIARSAVNELLAKLGADPIV